MPFALIDLAVYRQKNTCGSIVCLLSGSTDDFITGNRVIDFSILREYDNAVSDSLAFTRLDFNRVVCQRHIVCKDRNGIHVPITAIAICRIDQMKVRDRHAILRNDQTSIDRNLTTG